MKLIIAGSRTVTDEAEAFAAIDAGLVELGLTVDDVEEVVSGGAKGPDRFGEAWARKNRIRVTVMMADWDRLGKRAGFVRNADMGVYAGALIALWDEKSPGTQHMIEFMKSKGKPYTVRKMVPKPPEPPKPPPSGGGLFDKFS